MALRRQTGRHVGRPGFVLQGFELPSTSSEGQPHLFPAYNLNEASNALTSGAWSTAFRRDNADFPGGLYKPTAASTVPFPMHVWTLPTLSPLCASFSLTLLHTCSPLSSKCRFLSHAVGELSHKGWQRGMPGVGAVTFRKEAL